MWSTRACSISRSRAWVGGAEEVEQIRVLERLRRYVRVGGWQRGGKIGDRLALPLVEAALNLQGQCVPAPTVLNGLAEVPFPISRSLNPVKQYAVVKPGNLCSKLLHNCPIRPGGGEGTHVFQVPGRQALHVGEQYREYRGVKSFVVCTIRL